MEVSRIECADLREATCRPAWDELAGSQPCLGIAWLGAWWKCYGQAGGLYVLQAQDEQKQIVGLAPLRRIHRHRWGRVVEFLGSGDACTDHLTLLTRADTRVAAAQAMAHWMLDRCSCPQDGWDHIELIGADADDSAVAEFAQAMQRGGARVHQRAGTASWCIHLPETWDAYVRCRSRNLRKNLRRWTRSLENQTYTVRTVKTRADLEWAWPILMDLHAKRRRELGDRGCFSRPGFEAFLREATHRLLQSQALILPILYRGRIPIAIEYQLRGGATTYAYQSGMDPAFSKYSPGAVLKTWTIQQCLQRGDRYLDLLRGDEAYKLRWKSSRCAMTEYRIAAPRASARFQHDVWVAGSRTVRWLRSRRRQLSANGGLQP